MGWLLILGGGLAGSAHCVGMCGPFVLALGALPGARRRWLRHVAYGLGRVFTYVAAGVLAGGLGHHLDRWLDSVRVSQGLFALAAGGLLIVQGLLAAGVPWPFGRPPLAGCPMGSMLGAMLRATRVSSTFLAGMVNGLIPCGLVYAYLTLALTSGGPLEGGLLMGLFGLGTMPALVLLGMGSSLLTLAWRRRLHWVAAACILLTGAVTCWRGGQALAAETGASAAACPGCALAE